MTLDPIGITVRAVATAVIIRNIFGNICFNVTRLFIHQAT
jgi:hypothetical protein